MTRLIFALLAMAVLSGPVSPARADLPPEVRADLLKTKLTAAMKEKRFPDALDLFTQLRALNLPLPASMDYFEAVAAAETQDWLRADARLTSFLTVQRKKSKFYQSALELYARIEPHVAEARRKAAAEATAEIQALADNLDFTGARDKLDDYLADGTIADRTAIARTIDEAEMRAVQSAMADGRASIDGLSGHIKSIAATYPAIRADGWTPVYPAVLTQRLPTLLRQMQAAHAQASLDWDTRAAPLADRRDHAALRQLGLDLRSEAQGRIDAIAAQASDAYFAEVLRPHALGILNQLSADLAGSLERQTDPVDNTLWPRHNGVRYREHLKRSPEVDTIEAFAIRRSMVTMVFRTNLSEEFQSWRNGLKDGKDGEKVIDRQTRYTVRIRAQFDWRHVNRFEQESDGIHLYVDGPGVSWRRLSWEYNAGYGIKESYDSDKKINQRDSTFGNRRALPGLPLRRHLEKLRLVTAYFRHPSFDMARERDSLPTDPADPDAAAVEILGEGPDGRLLTASEKAAGKAKPSAEVGPFKPSNPLSKLFKGLGSLGKSGSGEDKDKNRYEGN
ncbi:MAG: hypothetical protein H6907_13825 [Hyphomicrobiales bacterium]|nr:hypothetical protein [Hyphomicrobiales bacterium]MCP5372801.1 hypothetical protein [Hyphomicrobiales bacterium]